jgi:hypothetical protein
MAGVPASNFHGSSFHFDWRSLYLADHVAAAHEGGHGVQDLAAAPQHARFPSAQAFYGRRRRHEVDVELLHVRPACAGRLWHASSRTSAPTLCAACVISLTGFERAEHVRRSREAEQLCLVGQQFGQVVQDERPVVGHAHEIELDVLLGRQNLPRHKVRVVLHLGEQHAVALLQMGAAPTIRYQVDRLGRVARPNNFLRAACADEVGNPRSRALVCCRGFFAQRVHATMDVRVGLAVIAVHGIQYLDRLLRRRRAIQIHQPLALDLPVQNREVGADALDVERHR